MKRHPRHPKPTKPRKLTATMGTKYLTVGLMKNKKLFIRPIHRVILETFVGKCPNNMECLHGIKGKLCNSIDNLSWGTRKQNSLDRLRDGTDNRGEKNFSHKLNAFQVSIIRKTYTPHGEHRISSYELAKVFNVHRCTIMRIIKKKSWRYL